MLFQRLLAEVQLSKLHSMRVIHVLAVCQYHSHHLPVHYSFRFKEFDNAFDIQLKFQSSSCLPVNTCFSLRSLWCDSQSYLHIIPSHFESSLNLFSEEDLPISFGNMTSPLYRPTSLAHTHRHPAETLVTVRVSHRFWGHKDALSEK